MTVGCARFHKPSSVLPTPNPPPVRGLMRSAVKGRLCKMCRPSSFCKAFPPISRVLCYPPPNLTSSSSWRLGKVRKHTLLSLRSVGLCKGGLKYPQQKVVNDCAIFETNKKPDAQHTWRTATSKCEEKLYKKRFYKAQEKSHCAAY